MRKDLNFLFSVISEAIGELVQSIIKGFKAGYNGEHRD